MYACKVQFREGPRLRTRVCTYVCMHERFSLEGVPDCVYMYVCTHVRFSLERVPDYVYMYVCTHVRFSLERVPDYGGNRQQCLGLLSKSYTGK